MNNNHCFIPPGEARVISIRAPRKSQCGLSLSQTGWRVSTWNAGDAVIDPSTDVLLLVGRRDEMCREFRGYFDPHQLPDLEETAYEGNRPDVSKLPWLLSGRSSARFDFISVGAICQRAIRVCVRPYFLAGLKRCGI